MWLLRSSRRTHHLDRLAFNHQSPLKWQTPFLIGLHLHTRTAYGWGYETYSYRLTVLALLGTTVIIHSGSFNCVSIVMLRRYGRLRLYEMDLQANNVSSYVEAFCEETKSQTCRCVVILQSCGVE